MLQRNSDRLWWPVVVLASSVFLGVFVTAVLSRGIPARFLLVLPLAALIVAKPEWAVMGILAAPGGLVMRTVPPVALGAGLLGLAILQVITTGAPKGARVGLPLAGIGLLAILARAPGLAGEQSSAATDFLALLLYYVALFFITARTVSDGRLSMERVFQSVMIGAVGGGLIYTAQAALSGTILLSEATASIDPGGMFYRTHFGFVMATGLASALVLLRSKTGPVQVVRVCVWFLTVMVLVSMTRGAWLAAFLTWLLLPTGERAWLRSRWSKAIVGGAVVVASLFLLVEAVPVVGDRVAGDLEGGVSRAFETGALGSGRVELWEALWKDASREGLVMGGGFGHMWTLTPQELFGMEVFIVERNPFVYAHNDFLYFMVDLGIVGVLLLVLFWTSLVRGLRRLRSSAPIIAAGATGICLVFLIAQLVDNGLFIQPLAERFVAIAGGAAALARGLKAPAIEDAKALEPSQPEVELFSQRSSARA